MRLRRRWRRLPSCSLRLLRLDMRLVVPDGTADCGACKRVVACDMPGNSADNSARSTPGRPCGAGRGNEANQ